MGVEIIKTIEKKRAMAATQLNLASDTQALKDEVLKSHDFREHSY